PALRAIDHRHEARISVHAPKERLALGVAPALARGPVLLDLIEGRSDGAEGLASDGELVVDDDAGDLPLAAAAHHPRLVGVDGEALVADDVGDLAEELAELGRGRGLLAGEGEVVGVAGVGEAELIGEALQAAIEAAAEDVGDRRARGRALGEAAGA